MTTHRLLFLLLLAAAAASPGRCGQPGSAVPVRLEQREGRWQLLRGGQPYRVQGAGGSGSMARLKAAGGNSVRTWGVEEVPGLLEEAQRLGMTVSAGIWLGHERHGFRYDDPAQVAAQAERVRKAVLAYRNHPALLLWSLGNEMEGDGKNPRIWKAIDDLAAMVKQLDPNHPTMTVIAEIGGEKAKNLHRLCPNVDVVGINSYGGAASLSQRYRDAGGSKPYILTEFGPPGPWEVGKTAWGAALESTSTEKAAAYRRAWQQAVAGQPSSLGGYAFLWGNKQEATPTWFGMLLPDGSKLAPVDVMTELWSGKPPANRCPVLRSLKPTGPVQLDPGGTMTASLDVSDPDGDPLQVCWVLQPEGGAGGNEQAALLEIKDAVTVVDDHTATVRPPRKPGAYRLFVYVRDGKGGAATANLPLLVRGNSGR